ncbi:hypothetical protein [Eikenella sp. Marseille-P7795]|uniref:hypothetical protein n=1 Tax=Eikenella sp. Marseille-P7795 TaxID=2866577 RepID=UPI001CE45EF3|nr:hypothetical protein [Eikenella sp. Marseille-P7795]
MQQRHGVHAGYVGRGGFAGYPDHAVAVVAVLLLAIAVVQHAPQAGGNLVVDFQLSHHKGIVFDAVHGINLLLLTAGGLAGVAGFHGAVDAVHLGYLNIADGGGGFAALLCLLALLLGLRLASFRGFAAGAGAQGEDGQGGGNNHFAVHGNSLVIGWETHCCNENGLGQAVCPKRCERAHCSKSLPGLPACSC